MRSTQGSGKDDDGDLLALTAQIVSAYVGHNEVAPSDIPALLRTTYQGLRDVQGQERGAERPVPAVPIADSVTDSHLICLEDGKPFQSLKRHLKAAFGMSPEDYREKWGLPIDYPMVAPAYARRRSELAKKSGLGRIEGQSD